MTKTTGMLTLDQYKGFRVGYRVQARNNYGPKAPEGVLKEISRTALGKQFEFIVDFAGKLISYRPKDILLSTFMDFPDLYGSEAKAMTFQDGDFHKWVQRDNLASCRFCGTIRVYDSAVDTRTCRGPVYVTFR